MLVVGITGGIASGKSELAECLRSCGAIVVDADNVGHSVIEEEEVLNNLVSAIDEDILDPDGKIDRKILGPKVFGNKEKLQILNETTLPRISEIINSHLEMYSKTLPPNQVVVIDAPLLVESGLNKQSDAVVLIRSDMNKRIERLTEKGYSPDEAMDRINSQLSDEELAKYADHIIDNNGSNEELREKARELWQQITSLSAF